MLDKKASAAWKEAGEAVSSRIVTARLKTVSRGKRRPYIFVISVYAPTAKAPPGIKGKFLNVLQDAIDKVPQSDVLLLLGDINT